MKKIISKKNMQTAVIYSGFLILGFNVGATGPSINDLAANSSVNASVISTIIAIRALGGFFGAFFGSRLFDKFKPKKILSILLAVSVLLFVSVPISKSFISTFTIFLIMGIVVSMIDTGSNISITRLHGRNSSTVLSGLHFSFGVGAFIFPPIVSWFNINFGNALYAYFTIAAFAILILLLYLIMKELPEAHESKEFSTLTINPFMIAVVMVFLFFYVGTEVTFGIWINNYSLQTGVADEVKAALITSFFYASFTLTRLLLIPILKRIKEKYILLISVFLIVCNFTTLLFIEKSILSISLISITAGITMAATIPVFISMVKHSFGYNGKMAGYLQGGVWLGALFFPWFSGRILGSGDIENFPKMLLLSAIMSLTFIIVIFVNISKKRVQVVK